MQPFIKAHPTALLEAVGAWNGGLGTTAAARRRADRACYDSRLADSLTELLSPARSAVNQVRDAQ